MPTDPRASGRVPRMLPEMPIVVTLLMLPWILTGGGSASLSLLAFVGLLVVLPLLVVFPAVFFLATRFLRRRGMPDEAERVGEAAIWGAITYSGLVAARFATTFIPPESPASVFVAMGSGGAAILLLWRFARRFLKNTR